MRSRYGRSAASDKAFMIYKSAGFALAGSWLFAIAGLAMIDLELVERLHALTLAPMAASACLWLISGAVWLRFSAHEVAALKVALGARTEL